MIFWQGHMRRRLSVWLLVGAMRAAFSGNLAQAQEASGNAPTPENVTLPPELQPTIASSVPALAEFKKGLYDLGYNLQFSYFADGLSNPSGGVKQGAAYEGLLYMVLDADLAKIAGLDGLSFRVNAYQIHGRQLSATNVFNLHESTASRHGQRRGCSTFGSNRSSATWRRSALVNWRPTISFLSANSATIYISTARSAGRRYWHRISQGAEDPTIRWLLRVFASKLARTITSLFSLVCTMAIL